MPIMGSVLALAKARPDCDPCGGPLQVLCRAKKKKRIKGLVSYKMPVSWQLVLNLAFCPPEDGALAPKHVGATYLTFICN
jgi:hypothetical protein